MEAGSFIVNANLKIIVLFQSYVRRLIKKRTEVKELQRWKMREINGTEEYASSVQRQLQRGAKNPGLHEDIIPQAYKRDIPRILFGPPAEFLSSLKSRSTLITQECVGRQPVSNFRHQGYH